MKTKLINNDTQKTYAVILDSGDEVTDCLKTFAREYQLSAAHFTAIGAFKNVTTGFYDFSIKDYRENKMDEQVEVLTLAGDVSLYKGEPKVHAHVVVGNRNGTAFGGHLLKAVAHPTLEVMITESPAYLKREMDEASGIPLIKID
jgi:predicted DNA-binding protein with PD1-like motif